MERQERLIKKVGNVHIVLLFLKEAYFPLGKTGIRETNWSSIA